MPDFKNLKDLFFYLQNDVAESMQENVLGTVKAIEQYEIFETVYGAYNVTDQGRQEPYVYERRYTEGGLGDVHNIEGDIELKNGEVTMKVINTTKMKDHPSAPLAPLVEYGDNAGYGKYDYKSNKDDTAYQYLQPRPFTQRTKEVLERDKDHVKTLKRSLESKGYDVV